MGFKKLTKFMLHAVEENDIKTVHKLLSKNRNLCSTKKPPSPIWLAVHLGHEEIVKLLIEFGADVNQEANVDFNNPKVTTTLLHFLAMKPRRNNYFKISELLIQNGAIVNAFNPRDIIGTPLKVAVSQGNIELAELFLKNGGSLQGEEWQGKSPADCVFRETSKESRKEMLKLLISYGLETSATVKFRENFIHYFINNYVKKDDHDAVEIVQILLSTGLSLETYGLPPLHGAISSGNLELVSFLISKGVLNKKTNLHHPPLLHAVECDDEGIVELLLSSGADVNETDYKGCTALHIACSNHKAKMINLLLKNGAKISPLDENYSTPFSLLKPDDWINTYHQFLTDEIKEFSKSVYDRCVVGMVKEFSKLNFENQSVFSEDLILIQTNPVALPHFEKCNDELYLMANTEFHAPYSFYSLLTASISIKNLSNLTRNEEIIMNFTENLQRFPYYEPELRRIWEEAMMIRENLEVVIFRLKCMFGDFFPDLVIRKLSTMLTVEDLPLERGPFNGRPSGNLF